MKTLGSLRTEALGWLDESNNTTETFTNVTNALNLAHRQRCSEQGWSFMLWRQPETFALVPNQRRYTMHPVLHRPLYVFNRTTGQYLQEMPWREVEASGVRWNADTNGERYVFVEPSTVMVQPSSDSAITIKSTSAGDSGSSFAVIVTGTVDGAYVTESLSPAGLTGVTSSNVFDAGGIVSITKTIAWAGTLTVTAGTTTLLTLRPSELSRSYPQVELLWLPQGTDTIEYRFYRKPRTLVYPGDVPDIPDEFADIILWDALILVAAYDGDITQARLSAWVDQRDKLLLQMKQTFLEGTTVAANPRFVRNFDSEAEGW